MNDGGNALDMVTAGAMEMESDPTELTIGLGGLPDREGHTTLDACVMDSIGRAGSVCFWKKSSIQWPWPGRSWRKVRMSY